MNVEDVMNDTRIDTIPLASARSVAIAVMQHAASDENREVHSHARKILPVNDQYLASTEVSFVSFFYSYFYLNL